MTSTQIAMALAPYQRNLQRLGLYLGRIDGDPGALTCDATVTFLEGQHAPGLIGEPLAQAIPRAWWSTPNRVCMLFAQVHAECRFRPLVEDLFYSADRLCEVFPGYFNYTGGNGKLPAASCACSPVRLGETVYGGRMGNTEPGDGYRFRGRGWPQLTGRDAYRTYSDVAGVDLTTNPDALLRLDVSARVTVAFMQRKPGLLAAADAGNVAQARRLWNGGANGLGDALEAFDKLRTLWGNP